MNARKLPSGRRRSQTTLPLVVVGRHRDAEVGDDDVGASVRVEVDRLGVARVGHATEDVETAVGPRGLGAQHEAGGHLARDDDAGAPCRRGPGRPRSRRAAAPRPRCERRGERSGPGRSRGRATARAMAATRAPATRSSRGPASCRSRSRRTALRSALRRPGGRSPSSGRSSASRRRAEGCPVGAGNGTGCTPSARRSEPATPREASRVPSRPEVRRPRAEARRGRRSPGAPRGGAGVERYRRSGPPPGDADQHSRSGPSTSRAGSAQQRGLRHLDAAGEPDVARARADEQLVAALRRRASPSPRDRSTRRRAGRARA